MLCGVPVRRRLEPESGLRWAALKADFSIGLVSLLGLTLSNNSRSKRKTARGGFVENLASRGRQPPEETAAAVLRELTPPAHRLTTARSLSITFPTKQLAA